MRCDRLKCSPALYRRRRVISLLTLCQWSVYARTVNDNSLHAICCKSLHATVWLQRLSAAAVAADVVQLPLQRQRTDRRTQQRTILCAQANSASYPSWDGKWVVAYGLRGEGLLWLIGAVVCLLAANRGSNCSFARAMDGRIVRCGIISSCQSAATSKIVKRFWSWRSM